MVQYIYIFGISAGAYVATENMHYCLLFEKNDKYPLDDYSALGLVEFNIICHYNKYGNEICDQVKETSEEKTSLPLMMI